MKSPLPARFAAAAAFALAAACSQTSGRLTGGATAQSKAEIRQIIDRLAPTTRFAPAQHEAKLWEATRTYMADLFELETPQYPTAKPGAAEAREVETKTYEWFEGTFGHKTRVNARVVKDAGTGNVKLQVTALLIEATPVFEDARSGVPLVYDWRLLGSNPKIEEAVADGVMRRYLAFVEGRPAPSLEFDPVRPIPGLKPKTGAAGDVPAAATPNVERPTGG